MAAVEARFGFFGRLSPRGLQTGAYAAAAPCQLQIARSDFQDMCFRLLSRSSLALRESRMPCQPARCMQTRRHKKAPFKNRRAVWADRHLSTSKRNPHELRHHHYRRRNGLGPDRLRPTCCRGHCSWPCRCHRCYRINGLYGIHGINRFDGYNRRNWRHRGDRSGSTRIEINQ